jgi:drug/metabolite transporter (DMT)-like permease
MFATLVSHAGPMPPLYLTGLSLCLGSLASIHQWRQWRVPAATFFFGTASLFIYHACLVAAFQLAPIAEANLVNYLWPLFLTLFASWGAGAARLTPLRIGGCVIAFAGCAFAIAPSMTLSSVSAPQLLGYALAGVAALTWAIYSLGAQRFPPYSSWATGGFCLAAGLLSLLAHVLFEAPFSPGSADIAWIAAIGIGPLGVSFVLWDMAMRHGIASRIAALSFSTPMLSTLALGIDGALGQDAWLRLGCALALVVVGVRLTR